MKIRDLDFTDELRGDDDPVSSPAHYQLMLPDGEPIEAIDYIHAVLGDDGVVAYCRGSALKYLSRAGRKDDYAQDLRKAAWFTTYAAGVLEFPRKPERQTLTDQAVYAIWSADLLDDALEIARAVREGTWKKAPEDDDEE